MVIRIYWASVTGNRKINSDQTRLRNLIESLRISSEWIDITTGPHVKERMRRECGNPKAMPPQIFNDSRYLGDVEAMEEFVEQGRGREWFGVEEAPNLDDALLPVVNGRISSSSSDDEGKITSPGDQVKMSDDKRVGASPSSSIESEVPSSASVVIHVPQDVPKPLSSPPLRKSVLAAAGAFEARSKEPAAKTKPKVVFTQSRSLNTERSENKQAADDKRRLRILGLANTTTENDER